ncbi:MAG: hypothetical protein QW334_02010 [Thermofilum sp.]
MIGICGLVLGSGVPDGSSAGGKDPGKTAEDPESRKEGISLCPVMELMSEREGEIRRSLHGLNNVLAVLRGNLALLRNRLGELSCAPSVQNDIERKILAMENALEKGSRIVADAMSGRGRSPGCGGS